VNSVIKPSWHSTALTVCTTCLGACNKLYLLCPDCVNKGEQQRHREGKHVFDMFPASATAQPQPSFPVPSPSPHVVPTGAGVSKLTMDSFQASVYDDRYDVLVAWTHAPESAWRLQLGGMHHQGKISVGHYCSMVLDSISRVIAAYQHDVQAAPNGHSEGQYLRFCHYDAAHQNEHSPQAVHMNHLRWMTSVTDLFSPQTGLFSPHSARELLALHGGFLLCPARPGKGQAVADVRDVIMDSCYRVDLHSLTAAATSPAVQEDYLVRRQGCGLFTSSPSTPLFHLPSITETVTFLHQRMRHGSFDLPTVLSKVKALRLDEAADLVSRIQYTAVRFVAARNMLSQRRGRRFKEEDIPPPLDALKDLPAVVAFTQRLPTYNQWAIEWIKLLDPLTVKLEDVPTSSHWPLWQQQLAEVHDSLHALVLLPLLQQHAMRCASAQVAVLRRQATLVHPHKTQLRPLADRLTLRMKTVPELREWNVVQVVSSSFEELVLDPSHSVVVLFFHSKGGSFQPDEPEHRNRLFVHLLYSLCTLSRLVTRYHSLYSAPGSCEGGGLRFAIFNSDTTVNAMDPSWMPTPCFEYWSGFKDQCTLLCFPAVPLSSSCSFSDEGQQQRDVARYDWTWGGRIFTQCFDHPLSRSPWRGNTAMGHLPPAQLSVWTEGDYIPPTIITVIEWVHSQLRGHPQVFDLERMKELAAPLLHSDDIVCQLNSASMHYWTWYSNVSQDCKQALTQSQPEPESIGDMAMEVWMRLPPVVELTDKAADELRREYAALIDFDQQVCLPDLQRYWERRQKMAAEARQTANRE
jgi:hypothetical protein